MASGAALVAGIVMPCEQRLIRRARRLEWIGRTHVYDSRRHGHEDDDGEDALPDGDTVLRQILAGENGVVDGGDADRSEPASERISNGRRAKGKRAHQPAKSPSEKPSSAGMKRYRASMAGRRRKTRMQSAKTTSRHGEM